MGHVVTVSRMHCTRCPNSTGTAAAAAAAAAALFCPAVFKFLSEVEQCRPGWLGSHHLISAMFKNNTTDTVQGQQSLLPPPLAAILPPVLLTLSP